MPRLLAYTSHSVGLKGERHRAPGTNSGGGSGEPFMWYMSSAITLRLDAAPLADERPLTVEMQMQDLLMPWAPNLSRSLTR